MLEDGERSRFLTPPAVANHRYAPVNALDYRRVMFTVDDTDETLAGARRARRALADKGAWPAPASHDPHD